MDYDFDPRQWKEFAEELAGRPARIRANNKKKAAERAAKREAEERKRRAEMNEVMRKAYASIGKEDEWTPTP